MAINIATATGGYEAIKEESATNDASVFIDTENFDLFGHFGNTFDFLNEKTIEINTTDYEALSTAASGTTNYELWHNPHITWVVREDNEWETIGLNSISIDGSTLKIERTSRESSYTS